MTDALPSLTDGVVEIRPFRDEDASRLARIWENPEIRRRNDVPGASDAEALTWVAGTRLRARTGEAWEWAVVDARSGELAGRRALKLIDRAQGRATAASWIAPEYRGRRLSARSLRLAAAHAFSVGLVRIQAEIEKDNDASLRSLLTAGMRFEGTLRDYFVRTDGTAIDQHVLGMLAEDLACATELG